MPTAVNKSARPGATTALAVYTVPANMKAVVTVNLCAQAPCNASLAFGNGASAPTDAEWAEFEKALGKGGVIERPQVILGPGFKVWVKSSVGNALAAQVWGIEEAAT